MDVQPAITKQVTATTKLKENEGAFTEKRHHACGRWTELHVPPNRFVAWCSLEIEVDANVSCCVNDEELDDEVVAQPVAPVRPVAVSVYFSRALR